MKIFLTLPSINNVGVFMSRVRPHWLVWLVFVMSAVTASSPFAAKKGTAPMQSTEASSPNPHHISDEIVNTGKNPLELVYHWSTVDIAYPTKEDREFALENGDFIPENIAPLGLAISTDRIFVTMPRWRVGVPVSLTVLPIYSEHMNPPFTPYPNWEFHADPLNPDCSKLMSVYRAFVDECGRLWVIDSGVVNATIRLNQVCPPKIVVFDLATDKVVLSYELPPDQVKEESLHSSIIVDIRDGQCYDAYAYVTDVYRNGLVVYSMQKQRSWRVTHHFFNGHPYASDFTLHGINFQWSDGVFGVSLPPPNEYGERFMYFHPMAGFEEYMVDSEIIRNETLWADGPGAPADFYPIGSRGLLGQSTTCAITRDGVMFFTLLNYDALACWDVQKRYEPTNLNILESNPKTLFFINDLKLDGAYNQHVWLLSNRLPVILYRNLDVKDINFRIFRANAKQAVVGTACDPSHH